MNCGHIGILVYTGFTFLYAKFIYGLTVCLSGLTILSSILSLPFMVLCRRGLYVFIIVANVANYILWDFGWFAYNPLFFEGFTILFAIFVLSFL